MQRYVDFKLGDGFLLVTLAEEGMQALDGSEEFADVIEWQLCNGWEWLLPEEVGALTDAPTISDDTERDDTGELVSVGSVYAYMDYQVFNPVTQLLKYGSISLVQA
jgi:hypothetical protein